MKLYVSNMLFKITEDDLRQAFSQFGQVESVDIVKDRDTGKSKGFGFIVMPSAEEAQAAIDGLNDSELSGREIRVSEARPRPDKPRGKKPSSGGRTEKGGPRDSKAGNRWGQGESEGGRSGQGSGGGRGGQSAFGGTRGNKTGGGSRGGQGGGGRGGQGGPSGGRGGQGRGR